MKPLKNLNKGMISMTAGGLIAGAGTKAIGSMGVSGVSGGLTTASSLMPAVGGIVGAGAVVGMASQLMPKKKRWLK